MRNIYLTLDALENAVTTQRRTAYLHNQNLKDALPIIIRGTDNRASVTQDPLIKADLEHIRTMLQRESRFFCDWMDGMQHEENVPEGSKRDRSRALRQALLKLKTLVEVRIASSAEFGYKYLERQRFNAAVDALAKAAKKKDKDEVMRAAREITDIVKEAEMKNLDSLEAERAQDQLRLDAAKLLKQAQANLKGDAQEIDTDAAKGTMEKL